MQLVELYKESMHEDDSVLREFVEKTAAPFKVEAFLEKARGWKEKVLQCQQPRKINEMELHS